MSGLPSFFQQRGKTTLDELADYELGGDSDGEDDGIVDDSAFEDGYNGADLELPSFFQPSARLEETSAADNGFPLRPDEVNLSHLLDNFTWPGKGNDCRLLPVGNNSYRAHNVRQ